MEYVIRAAAGHWRVIDGAGRRQARRSRAAARRAVVRRGSGALAATLAGRAFRFALALVPWSVLAGTFLYL